MLAPCIFELRKVKVARNEKKEKGIKVIMCIKKNYTLIANTLNRLIKKTSSNTYEYKNQQ
jgi:hypothetical protein